MTDAGRVIAIDVGQAPAAFAGVSRATIVEGDTGPEWQIGHRTSPSIRVAPELADLVAAYSCWLAVAESAPAILREVTDTTVDNTRFRVWLTPEETAALGPGTRMVGIELRNPALDPPLIAEVQWSLQILAGVVEGGSSGPGAADGAFDFSYDTQSGLLALILEDF